MGDFWKRFVSLQEELKVPKNNYNSFGKYKFRSAEDILEHLKPLCKKYGIAIFISDKALDINGWHYIEATANVIDMDNGEPMLKNTALARESEVKKGMDDSQITGTASSYARKYCLNGLLLIDDTKDADTNEYRTEVANTQVIDYKAEFEKKVRDFCAQDGCPDAFDVIMSKISAKEHGADYWKRCCTCSKETIMSMRGDK